MSRDIRAVMLALAAAACFAAAAALAKLAAQSYPVLQILFIRQLLVLASTLPVLWRAGPGALTTRRPGLHALRLAAAFVALTGDLWALKVLPLATVTTIGFSKVLFAVLLAAGLLREPLRLRGLAALGLGLGGIALVLQPGFAAQQVGVYALPLIAALAAAVASVSVRGLAQTDGAATLLLYQALFVGVLAGAPMPWLWRMPDGADAALLLSIGALSVAGQWAGIHALRLGAIGLVGPMEYTRVLYAALFGLILFHERPTTGTALGAALIVLACLAVLRRR